MPRPAAVIRRSLCENQVAIGSPQVFELAKALDLSVQGLRDALEKPSDLNPACATISAAASPVRLWDGVVANPYTTSHLRQCRSLPATSSFPENGAPFPFLPPCLADSLHSF
jgi:hypothetical protein